MMLSALLLALGAQDAAPPVRVDVPPPRLRAVKLELYQVPIVSTMQRCMSGGTVDMDDSAAATAQFDADEARCRTEIVSAIDAGEIRNGRDALTPRQRRDTLRAMAETAQNYRISRRHYAAMLGPGSPYLPQIDPNGPIGRGVKVYDPVAPQYEAYVQCVSSERRKLPLVANRETQIRDADRSIAACAALRGTLTSESDAILARQPDFKDAPKRAAAIAGMFDGFDAMTRAIARGEGLIAPQASR